MLLFLLNSNVKLLIGILFVYVDVEDVIVDNEESESDDSIKEIEASNWSQGVESTSSKS